MLELALKIGLRIIDDYPDLHLNVHVHVQSLTNHMVTHMVGLVY
jgi:hypothetical protein